MTTTPFRRFAAGATTALIAAALIAPAAAAVADEAPLEDPTTTVLEEAPAGEPAAAPAEEPAPQPASEPTEEPTEDPAPAADPAPTSAGAAPTSAGPAGAALGAGAALAAPGSVFTPTIEPGATWTTSVTVDDMIQLSVIALGTDITGMFRTPGGDSLALIGRPDGFSHGFSQSSTPLSGTVTITLRNEGSAARTVPVGFSYRNSTVELASSISGHGTTSISISTAPRMGGVPRPDAVATARLVALDGTVQTTPMTPNVPGSNQRWATFADLPAGPYMLFTDVTIDGEQYSALIGGHAAEPETTPPSVAYTTNPAASNPRGWFARQVTVELRASDTGAGVARIHHSLDGAPFESTGGWYHSQVVGEGVHELTYYAVDLQGNESEPVTRTIRVDVTAPVAALDGVPAEVEEGEQVTISWWCDDALSLVYDCSVVGGVEEDPAEPGTGVLDTTTPGSHEVRVVATDRAGNVAHVARTYRVLSDDRVAPALEVDRAAEPASGWYTEPVTVSFTADDGEEGTGVARIRWQYRTNSGTVIGSTTEPTGELVLDRTGVYDVEVWAEDVAGNRTETLSFTVRVDVSAPTIRVTSPVDPIASILPNGHYAQNERAVVDFACDDQGSGLASCDATTPRGELLPTGVPGTHELRIVATDVAGNRTERVISYTVDAVAASPTASRDPRLAQTGAEIVIPGIALVAVLLAAGATLLTARRLGGR